MLSSKLFRVVVTLALIVMFTTGAVMAQKPNTLDRAQIPDEYKWDLTHIYPSWEAWEADLPKLQAMMDRFVQYQGRLSEGPEVLVEVEQLSDSLTVLAYKLYGYVGLANSVATDDNEIQAYQQQIGYMFAMFGQSMAWFNPELLAIGEETVMQWVEDTPELKKREFGYRELFRNQEHVLNAEQEQLLSYFNRFQGTPGNVYSMLSTADVEFPEVTLSDGRTVKATHGEYAVAKETYRNQEDREVVFKGHFSTLNDFENTYAAIFNGMLQSQIASAKARKYESTAQMALFGNDIPVEVMENLIETAKAGSEPLQRWCELRKQALGLESYRYFDAYIPLVDVEWPFYYDELRPQIVESVEIFGDEYANTVDEAFEKRWFDVYEAEGKRSGAFSMGVYGVHPYMLLNHTDTMRDAFTLAHEMGHTMHTVLSHENQPIYTAQYTIFVAEVASTMNEWLFLDYLLENTDDPDKRIALLEYVINSIHGTFYRQAMFADFELKMHRAAEAGQPITSESLQQMYLESMDAFFGDSLDDKEWYRNTWARISHFMRPFYVYQYATSIASSSLMHERITDDELSDSERMEAVDGYLELLRSGGKDHPIDLLRTAGVDWSTPKPAEAMVAKMTELVDRLEKELRETGRI